MCAIKGEITLKELSALANLSINTISRALNERDGVSRETREYVQSLAREHNYRPNMMARSMRGQQSTLIGTLVGDMTDNFFVELLSGVEEETTKESMPIIIGNTGEDIQKQQATIDMLLSYGCRNFIITPVQGNTTFIETLSEKNANLVIADRTIESADSVHQIGINNRKDSYRTVEYLIRCGHRRIAVVNQRSDIGTETDRTQGYLEALADNGIERCAAYIVNCENRGDVPGAMHRLLTGPECPSAVFIAKDTLSLNAVSAIYDAGLRVPEDISVVLYGSPEWSQSFRPYFTCMARAVKDIGRTSARIIIDQMKGNRCAGPINIKFDSNLVIRDSVRMI